MKNFIRIQRGPDADLNAGGGTETTSGGGGSNIWGSIIGSLPELGMSVAAIIGASKGNPTVTYNPVPVQQPQPMGNTLLWVLLGLLLVGGLFIAFRK